MKSDTTPESGPSFSAPSFIYWGESKTNDRKTDRM